LIITNYDYYTFIYLKNIVIKIIDFRSCVNVSNKPIIHYFSTINYTTLDIIPWTFARTKSLVQFNIFAPYLSYYCIINVRSHLATTSRMDRSHNTFNNIFLCADKSNVKRTILKRVWKHTKRPKMGVIRLRTFFAEGYVSEINEISKYLIRFFFE